MIQAQVLTTFFSPIISNVLSRMIDVVLILVEIKNASSKVVFKAQVLAFPSFRLHHLILPYPLNLFCNLITHKNQELRIMMGDYTFNQYGLTIQTTQSFCLSQEVIKVDKLHYISISFQVLKKSCFTKPKMEFSSSFLITYLKS